MNPKCSCTKRNKEKCVEESSTGGGKMCVKESLVPETSLGLLDEAHSQFNDLTKNIDQFDWELWEGDL